MDIDFTNYPHNLSSNELIFIIAKEFPDLVHGVDYWTMHQVEQNSSVRVSPAILYQWQASVPKPTPEELAAFATTYADEIEALRLIEKRSGLYPAMTPLEFRNLLTANAIYPRTVSTLIDAVQDEALNARLATYWEYTDWFRRDDEFTVWLAGAIGKTPAEFDAIWSI
ncbi:hypothetical protein [Rhizobium sp. P007]|uniref:XkdW family protein n=1 Tax=Rhizobium sp. P007 TaxID=285908 RepID=UPI0011597573|nr:hypothetical protein [Rhizobium sp. P007]CAD7041237.1 hypothetical protein RP007_00725 [Rhizobium sp. P007]